MRRLLLAIALAAFALPALAQPTITPDSPVMKLDEIGLYSVGWVYRGKAEQRFPDGWSGFFEDATGVACLPLGEQDGKRAFLLHCPWRGGTGVAFQQFSVNLPARASRITLRGAIAMRADIVGKSDGATFRIFVNGKKLLDENRKDAVWQPFSFDLTALKGSTVTLRFETDPGPADNPGFDYSLWGDRELTIDGVDFAANQRPDPPALDVARLADPFSVSGVLKLDTSGVPGFEGDTATFTYTGADGTITYRWNKPNGPGDPAFGAIRLHARMKGDTAVEAPVATAAQIVWTRPARFVGSQWLVKAAANGQSACVLKYDVSGTPASVTLSARLDHKRLKLDVACDQPLISSINGGSFGPVMRRVAVTSPYNPCPPYYLPNENLFVCAYPNWLASNASAQEGTTATYGALTDGSRNPVREQFVYTAAWHLAEVFPEIPNPPSPFRDKLADRVILDIWGGRYTDIARTFETLKEYGIDHCVALIHDWQRSGYDNALPDHVPAAADKGGDAGMKVLVQTGVRLGYLVALHENYVDYYPNYDHFNENDIALDSAGKRVPAWYNPGTKIQSFAVKPTAILRLAATQSPEINQRYGTNADYLDVHSAVPPWFHVDFRAGEPGAGEFKTVFDAHRDLWAYERKTHRGPVFGEGNMHAYWSGLLDGVEAQFGTGWPGNQGMSAPLAVDFDVLRIHPLQFNHGMGYYERWWGTPQWGSVPPLAVLDQYRMQEVIYGHAGFLSATTWNNLPYVWLEHHLLSPVTARYGNKAAKSIRYEVGGKWVDGAAAAKARTWNRVEVSYANGLTITANDAEQPMSVGDVVLPRFGWVAKGAGVTAWTALKGGVVADYAETADSVFANARDASLWNTSGLVRIRPTATSFRQTGPRAFTVTYAWQVDDTLKSDCSAFVHFSKNAFDTYDEGIVFQQDHGFATPTSRWERGATFRDGPYTIQAPANVADGDYSWTIGLVGSGGGRVSLTGVDDGHGRIRLGVLRVRGDQVTFQPETGTGEEKLAWYTRNVNAEGKIVDFGAVRTNGSVLVRREGGQWVLRAMPRDGKFAVELSRERFGAPAAVRCEGGAAPTVSPTASGAFWKLELNGAKTYSWPAR